jgi:hypothetical protein
MAVVSNAQPVFSGQVIQQRDGKLVKASVYIINWTSGGHASEIVFHSHDNEADKDKKP